MAALQDQGVAEFTAAERAALAYAEELTRHPHGVAESTFANLRVHWSERAIVELTVVACLFNFTNRFNGALQTDNTVYPKALG